MGLDHLKIKNIQTKIDELENKNKKLREGVMHNAGEISKIFDVLISLTTRVDKLYELECINIEQVMCEQEKDDK